MLRFVGLMFIHLFTYIKLIFSKFFVLFVNQILIFLAGRKVRFGRHDSQISLIIFSTTNTYGARVHNIK